MKVAEFAERELRNVWNKYVSNDVRVWERMYALDYRSKLESNDQRARHYVIGGILSELANPRPAILDVGCGCGTTFHLLPRKEARYHGIDLSETAIRQAIEAYPSPAASFEVADFESYEPRSKFDAVIFNEVLYYFPVSTIERILKKAVRLFANSDSLLIISMSDNPKAKVLWQRCRFLGEPVHDINIRTRVRSSRWTVRAFRQLA